MPNLKSTSVRAVKSRMRPRRGPEEKLRRLVDAAYATFAERGYHATTIHEICRRAGVGVGTFYAHFGSKSEVLARVIEEHSDRTLASIRSSHLLGIAALARKLAEFMDDPRAVGLDRAWREAVLDDARLRRIDSDLRRNAHAVLTSAVAEARDLPLPQGSVGVEPGPVAWAIIALTREFVILDRRDSPDIERIATMILELVHPAGARRR
jgi:AcrR family transcriptional regulator